MLRVADHAVPVRTLGPGVRFVLWVQGCDRACPGCTSPDWRPLDGGRAWPPELLAHDILRRIVECGEPIEGLTISGGEPMLQAQALLDLWEHMLRARPTLSLVLFSGRTTEELDRLPGATQLAACADILVTGPYRHDLDDGQGLRGSANQRITLGSERYRGLAASLETQQRRMQAFDRPRGMFFAGIPPRGFHSQLRAAEGAAGRQR